jgi:hypothetical protein
VRQGDWFVITGVALGIEYTGYIEYEGEQEQKERKPYDEQQVRCFYFSFKTA